MVWVVLVITGAVILLIGMNVVPLLLGLVLIIVGLLVSVAIGERLDRGRRSLTHNGPPPKFHGTRHFDANRGDFHGSSSDHSWQSPQAYIDRNDEEGTPRGAER